MIKKKGILTGILMMITLIYLTGCASNKPEATAQFSFPIGSNNSDNILKGNPTLVWERLQPISPSKLANMQNDAKSPDEKAWVDLALLSKQNRHSSQQFASQLNAWRARNPSHPANQLFPDSSTLNKLQTAQTPQHIALLLPLSGTFGTSGQKIREGFLKTYYTNKATQTQQSIKFYDTAQNKPINELYQQAIAEGADCVIGPVVKSDVAQLSANPSLSLPTLMLNYSTENTKPASPNLFEFGLAPEDEIKQIANRARSTGLARAIIIAPETTLGKRLASNFTTQWQALGGNIQDTWYYSSQSDYTDDVAKLLKVDASHDSKLMHEKSDKKTLEQQRRQDFDVIVLFSQPKDARIIVPLLRYNYVSSNIPIYAASSALSSKRNAVNDADLNGVTICAIPNAANSQDKMEAVGADAYVLSQSLQRMKELPNFPVYGSTGALVLSSNQQIHRRLPCRTVHDGQL